MGFWTGITLKHENTTHDKKGKQNKKNSAAPGELNVTGMPT